MKRLLRFSIMLLALLLPATASAHDFEVDGIFYNIIKNVDDNEVMVTYKGDIDPYAMGYNVSQYSGEITIPDSVTFNGTTYLVTFIDNCSFYRSTNLTNVNIGNTVTAIGEYAFSGCSSLIDITIPNSVTSIETDAFYGTPWYDNQPNGIVYAGLVVYKYKGDMPEETSITLEEGTKGIAGNAFCECYGLSSINIPNSVTTIGSRAFDNCSGLTSIEIPNSITHIGSYAFSKCGNLENVSMGNSVISIGYGTFSQCYSLTSIDVPNSVTDIGSSAFSQCGNLENVNMGNSVKSIGYHAFHQCYSLTSIDIPNSVTSIGDYAFYNCSSLTSIVIPDSLTSIPSGLFSQCSSLKSVIIGNSVTSINDGAFYNCSSLTGIDIPNSVTSIGDYAFCDCSSLTSIEIPNSVTSIGEDPFNGTPWLDNHPDGVIYVGLIAYKYSGIMPDGTSITLEDGTIGISSYAFKDCIGLGSINIPNSVNYIGYYAFSGCKGLTSLTIPDSITYIDEGVFSGCSSLAYIEIPNSVTYLGYYAFGGCSSLTNIEIPNSVTRVGEGAFSGCSGLPHIDIPNSVTYIGYEAFRGCSGLTCVNIPNSVTGIGERAFSGCNGLTSVTLGKSITSISNNTFSGCTALDTLNFNAINCADFSSTANYRPFYNLNISTINIGDSVQRIPNYFANGLTALTNLTIGKSVTSIGNYAFTSCTGIKQLVWDAINCSSNGDIPTTNIEQVIIGEHVQTIPQYFVRYSKITEVAIPNSVTYIGYNAFYGCSNLTRVNITDLAAWCNIFFYGQSANPLYYAHHLFLNNNVIINLEIPDSVTNIGDYAFIDCSDLTNVFIPNSITDIGGNAFTGCAGIKQLTWNAISCSSNGDMPTANIEQVSVGNEVQVIPHFFANGSRITEVNIPNSVTVIGSNSFSGCTGLTGVTIPNSVTTIWNNAFYGCTGLTSLTIGQSVSVIGNSAFSDCTGLTGELTLPNSVTNIGNHAFYGCNGLKGEMTIPNSVTNIGSYAFYCCTGLTGLTIPNSVTNIGSYAFQGCTGVETLNYNAINCADFDNTSYQPFYNLNITTINIGDSVQRIPAYFAYGLQKLSSVAIPSSIISVGTQAFYNCPIIESVTSLATTPPSSPSTGDMAFFNTNVYIHSPLYVPIGTEKSYMYDQGWGQFINVIGIKTQDDVMATEITLDQSVMSMILGTSSQLVATVLPDSTTNKAVAWASSNPNVTTVDENGVVTAMGLGNALITAVTTDGSNLSATCRVIVTSMSTTNGFAVADAEVMHGKEIVIPIAMNNDQTILAFQTDIYLPQGFSIVLDEDYEYMITPSSRLTEDHIMMANDGNGAVSVVCYTPEGRPIGGNSGEELFYITVQVPEDASGDYAIYLRNSRLTTADYTELRVPDVGAVVTVKSFILGDANDSRTVTVTDIVVTAQYVLQLNPNPFIFEAADMNSDGDVTVTDIMLIAYLINHPTMDVPKRMPALDGGNDRMSGEGVTLMSGETRTVSIMLDNETEYTAFQLDLTLPAGLIASNFQLTDRAGRHAFDVNTLSNGNIRALCYSPSIELIDGHEGALLTFDVTAVGDVTGGIFVNGIEMVTAGCQTVLLDAFTIGVNNATSVNELNNYRAIARIDYFNLAGQRINCPKSGVTLVVTTYTDGTRTTNKVIQK